MVLPTDRRHGMSRPITTFDQFRKIDTGFSQVKLLRIKNATEDWEDGVLEASAPESRPKTNVRRT